MSYLRRRGQFRPWFGKHFTLLALIENVLHSTVMLAAESGDLRSNALKPPRCEGVLMPKNALPTDVML